MGTVSSETGFGVNFHSPAVISPRHQFFGQNGTESALTSPTIPDQSFLPGTEGFDSEEAKRRRIAKACDVCRKKKIKCDGKQPKCTHCINYNTECIFTHVEKKRNPPKGAKYIEGLENRLHRMEALLRMADLFEPGEDDNLDLATLEKKIEQRRKEAGGVSSPSIAHSERSNSLRPISVHPPSPLNSNGIKSPSTTSVSTPVPEADKQGEVEELSDMLCSLVTNTRGESKFIGSSSGFSIFSPQGIAWVSEKTGDASFQEMIAQAKPDDGRLSDWRSNVFVDLFARRVYQPLPSKAEALSLLEDFFQNFNCIFPLFHQPTFMHLVELQYSRTPYDGSGWWASLNVALAIAHRLRVMSQLVPKSEDDKAWGYLKNAVGVLTELAMRNTDLLSIQALLGMALFLLGTPNPQPSFFLVSAAIRTAHAIGLHKRGSTFNLNQVEIEQRSRVFWIAYMLDKDICLRTGRPPAQDDDDMNVDLPTEDPEDNIGNIPLADGKGKVNLFRMMCCIARIESRVYKQLYSARAAKQTEGELLHTIGELDRELEAWKDSVPIDFRPEHEIKAAHTPLVLHVVVLHLTYYNCLATIHRMSIQQGYWTSRLADFAIQGLNMKPLNPRVFSSAALSVAAARATISLLKYVPQGDFACVWMILYFPISALITLFSNVIQNPNDPKSRTDIKLMGQVVEFLSNITMDEEDISVRRTSAVCSMFERISKVVVEKADKEASTRRKRKSHAGLGPSGPATKSQATENAIPAQMMANGLNSGPGARINTRPLSSSHPAIRPPQYDINGMHIYNGLPMATADGSYAYDPGMDALSMDPAYMSNIGDGRSSTLDPSSPSFLTQSASSMPLNFDDLHHEFQDGGLAEFDADGFQPPFVPQDLWQMPMSFDFDWQDLTAGYPQLDGLGGNGLLGG